MPRSQRLRLLLPLPATPVDPGRLRAVRQEVLAWYETNARDHFPWRKQPVDPFHTLVFEVLVHQTFARKIVPVYLAHDLRRSGLEKKANYRKRFDPKDRAFQDERFEKPGWWESHDS